jgi:hypothetical protein
VIRTAEYWRTWVQSSTFHSEAMSCTPYYASIAYAAFTSSGKEMIGYVIMQAVHPARAASTRGTWIVREFGVNQSSFANNGGYEVFTALCNHAVTQGTPKTLSLTTTTTEHKVDSSPSSTSASSASAPTGTASVLIRFPLPIATHFPATFLSSHITATETDNGWMCLDIVNINSSTTAASTTSSGSVVDNLLATAKDRHLFWTTDEF